jgi:hypothetical protein
MDAPLAQRLSTGTNRREKAPDLVPRWKTPLLGIGMSEEGIPDLKNNCFRKHFSFSAQRLT